MTFRDGDLIRPVAPFYEIWARVGDAGSAPATWREVPLTPALLQANGIALAAAADEGHRPQPEGRAADREPAARLRHVSASDDRRQR